MMSMMDWLPAPAVVVVIGVTSSLLALAIRREYLRIRANSSTLPLPPRSPGAGRGVLATLRLLNDGNAPWWMLAVSRAVAAEHVGCGAWRMDLPLLPGRHAVVVSDPIVARMVLSDNFGSAKPWLVYSGFERAFGGVSFATTYGGERWRHPRRAINPAFAPGQVRRMMDEVASRHLKLWLNETLQPKLERGEPIDVAEEMVRLTIAIACEALFEYSISKEEIDMFVAELQITVVEHIRTQVGNPLRLLMGWFIPGVIRARQATRRLRELARRMLESYRRGSSSRRCVERDDSYKPTVISLIDSDSSYRSDEERVSDLLVLLFAGHDSSAYSMAWTLLELAKNRTEQRHLREELRSAANSGKSITKSRALASAIKEALRMHPVAAMGTVRTTSKDIVLQRHRIPRGSMVFVHFLSIQRNCAYISNPDSFQPSRWDCPDESTLKAFIPFSLGSRNCQGQHLAKAEMETILSRLCMDYEFTVVKAGAVDHYFTLKPVGVLLSARKVPPHE